MNAGHAAESDWRSEHDRSARSADARTRARLSAAGGFPAPGGGGRGVGVGKPLGVLRPYHPPTWFHPVGIRKVLARLLPRLPDVGGKLFITFTFDRNLFADPGTAFEHGRDRLRRIFYRLRHGVTWDGKRHVIRSPYCIKVEFHEDGWPHFHAVFLTRLFLPGDLLNDLWSYGRTNVGRIKDRDFHYLLKYVTKGGELPAWALRRSRLRVFQSSRGFYPATRTEEDTQPKSPKDGIPRKRRPSTETLGERIERWRHLALLEQDETFTQLRLARPYADLLGELILPIARAGRYRGNGHLTISDIEDLIPWINPRK